jgi:hypothetical protein
MLNFLKKINKNKVKKSKTLSKIESGIDKPFLIITFMLVITGLIIFSSAIIMLIGTAKYDTLDSINMD